uniref:Uncharacterized protein n=1 Tax=Meloidogyne incognita TaxID=6306 RepID=A0A914ND45_MELIC
MFPSHYPHTNVLFYFLCFSKADQDNRLTKLLIIREHFFRRFWRGTRERAKIRGGGGV